MTRKEIDDIFQEYGQYATGKDYALVHAIAKTVAAQKCVCGEPNSSGTHRTDGPCLAPQRTWVGLDWNEMPEIYMNDKAFEHGAQWAETKLKEKNT